MKINITLEFTLEEREMVAFINDHSGGDEIPEKRLASRKEMLAYIDLALVSIGDEWQQQMDGVLSEEEEYWPHGGR
jgi:hypothetical protein